MSEPIKSKRPVKRDKFVVSKAAEFGLEPVLKWLRDGDPDAGKTEADMAAIKDDFTQALGGWDLDGYKLAKELDDWEPDAALVETLDSADSWVRKAHDQACSEWVRIHTPPVYALGTVVFAKYRGKKVQGEVVRADEAYARYTVRCRELGHGPRSGLVLDYEELEVLTEGNHESQNQTRPEKTVVEA